MNPVLFPTDLPADAGNRLLAYDNELEQRRIRNRLLDYGEASLDGLSRMGRAIDPMRFVSERDVVGFLPGAGMVEGYEQMGTARDKFREGDYLGAAGDYALGAFNSVTDVIPAMAVLPPVRTGIRAYHGSPHDFDRFSLKYINTGEGAQARGHGLYFAEIEDVAREYRDRLSQGKAPGRLYEVRINADPDAFLDWDAPVSEQSERVRQSLLDLGIGTRPSHERLKGDQVHRRLAHAADVPAERSRQAAAQALRESGIPGIKYLDAGSRASGQGSRNYVVFDDSLIEILRKYGVSGLAALPAGVLAGMGLTREQAEDLDANRAM